MKQGDRRILLPRLLLIQLCAAAALFVGVLGTSASAGTNIAAGSASVVAGSQGTSTTVVTRAPADTSLNAYDIILQFDPARVSVVNVAPGSGWSLMPAPRINNVVGTVQVIAVRFDICPTTCPVFSITWQGVSPGTSALTLAGNANESLAGLGEYITSGFSAGSVTVTAPVTPSPTATPSAPASPSPSPSPSATTSPTATPTTPATPAPGAPAVILGGGGGAASGATFTSTTGVNLGSGGSRPMPHSFDITLKFDPGIATVTKLAAGDGWSFAPQPVIDNVAGTFHASALSFSDCASYCPLFQVEWKAVTPGPMQLTLQGDANLVLGSNGANQPAVYTPGTIVVLPAASQGTPGASQPTPGAGNGNGNSNVPVLPTTAGWNLLTWGGESMTPQQALSASNPGNIEVIYVWDPATGKWRRYGPKLPGYLNDLTTVKRGDVIWLSARN